MPPGDNLIHPGVDTGSRRGHEAEFEIARQIFDVYLEVGEFDSGTFDG